jgi:microcystin-dependent protein
MTININYTDQNKTPIQIADTNLDQTSTPLTLIGKKYNQGYSEIVAENFVHLLENFSFGSPPDNPVQGQLWFNTNALVNNDTLASTSLDSYGLKVFDGSNWLPLGVLKKSAQAPTIESAVSTNLKLGDLYVDTAKQQLYIYNGTGWTLIGPQYNAGEKTGVEVELIVDASNNVVRPILSVYVKTRRVAIISDTEFTPKSLIEGFALIKEGINLTTSTLNLNSAGVKFWGLAEKAETLVIGDETVDAKNFLRSDKTSTTNFGINIRSNNGLSVGSDLSFNVGTESTGSFLYNKIAGSTIDLRLRKSNAIKTILRVSSTNDDIQRGSIGINNLAPEESLDVYGNIKTNGRVIITGDASNSISTPGGLVVVKDINLGGNINVGGLTTVNDIEPTQNAVWDIGTAGKKFNTIYANFVGTETEPVSFRGTFYASSNPGFFGNVSGTSTGLATAITLQLSGDVDSNTVSVQTAGNNLTLNTQLSQDVISTKTESTAFLSNDVLLLERANQLYRIKKSSIVNSIAVVPVGTIVLFSGSISKIPQGYLLCDGDEKLQTEYGLLYNVIGYNYRALEDLVGPRSGLSTFALPDLTDQLPTYEASKLKWGIEYVITEVGTTDWTLLGLSGIAAKNVVFITSWSTDSITGIPNANPASGTGRAKISIGSHYIIYTGKI